MTRDPWQTAGGSDGYTQLYRKRRSKTDWAGVGVGEAFKSNLDYYLRLSSQRVFYRMVKRGQTEVARLTGAGNEDERKPKVKPQLSPCYSTYPSTLAAHAAIGLTAFLEFKARVREKILFSRLESFLDDPAEVDKLPVDPDSYKMVAETVTRWVQTRLLLEDLSREPSLSAVEIYRLFSASQETLKFRSLSEIIRSVILYGDVLPDWDALDLHSFTRRLLKDLTATSAPFFETIAEAKGAALVTLGERWVRAACRSLARYLPAPKDEKPRKKGDPPSRKKDEQPGQAPLGKTAERFGHERTDAPDTQTLAPLEGPNPPFLHEPRNAAEHVSNALSVGGEGAEHANGQADGESREQDTAKTLSDFSKAVEGAGGQKQTCEDMRSDLLEHSLRVSPFEQGPIEGNPTDGHEISIQLDGGLNAGGEIFDIAEELSEDWPACEKLQEEVGPITEALRRSLYPNIQQVPETERFRTSGSLDPARLPLADFASAIFRRYRIREKADRRGRPVLVIACDGSGSLNRDQMKMVKVLAAGWLNSTVRSDVLVLAGLYHSGRIRPGVNGPLVRWIYHPRKTPATSRGDAMRALVSMPNTGTGVQSDALSLAFIMEEARQLARGNMVYLCLISDTAWNRSFHTERGGEEEVRSYFRMAYEEFPGKLHTTLVALGVSGETGFEEALDAVITVSDKELKDHAAVAEKIGVYVASCMRERNRLVTGG